MKEKKKPEEVNNCDKCKYRKNSVLDITHNNLRSNTILLFGCDTDLKKSVLTVLTSVFVGCSLVFDEYYITNAIKCETHDVKPTEREMALCYKNLMAELDIIKPENILIMGEVAFKSILGGHKDPNIKTQIKYNIQKLRGSPTYKNGIMYIVTHSPADICKNSSVLRDFMEDIRLFVNLCNYKKPKHSVKIIETEQDMIDVYNLACNHKEIAIDIETNKLSPFFDDSEILSIGFCVEPFESFVLPTSYPTNKYFDKWGYVPKLNVLSAMLWIMKLLKTASIKKVFHNTFDVIWLEHIFKIPKIDNIDDTMLIQYLINPEEKKDLKTLVRKFTDMGNYEFDINYYVNEKNPCYSNIPPQQLFTYNGGDADGTKQIYPKLKKILFDLGMDKVLYDFLIPNLRGLIQIQKNGIGLDINQCRSLQIKYTDEIIDLKNELRALPEVLEFERLTGIQFNPASSSHKMALAYGGTIPTAEKEHRLKGQVGPSRYKKADIKGYNIPPILIYSKDKNKETQSFSKKAIQKFLKSIFKDIKYLDKIDTFDLSDLPNERHCIMPFIKLVSKINTYQTQLTNHIEPFMNIWGKSIHGRVHTTYNAAVARTGRLSSSNPNLNNLTREGFVKAPLVSRWNDGVLIEADYSMLELRVLGIFSQDKEYCKAFMEGLDLHKEVASDSYKVPVDSVTKDMRTAAKKISFGIVYQKWYKTLAEDLNVSETEARTFLKNYFNKYSGVRDWITYIVSFAERNGYVETLTGRRRFLDFSDYKKARRKAVNTPIQGTASDICFRAVNILNETFEDYHNGVAICGTVYDSIWVDVRRPFFSNVVNIVKYSMENVPFPWITVPLKVDIKYGKNLGDMVEWDGTNSIY